METLSDYVNWIACSLGYDLDSDQLEYLADDLIRSKKYKEVVRELEIKILEMVKDD